MLRTRGHPHEWIHPPQTWAHHTPARCEFLRTAGTLAGYNGNDGNGTIRGGRMSPKPEPSSRSPQSAVEPLVDVFGSKDDSEAMVVQGLLESAGIESALVSLDAPQEVLPGVGGMVIRVAPENAEKARQLIEEYRTSAEQASDEDESDDTSGPAA
jgi:Putative prokaryotic signal transducing protein